MPFADALKQLQRDTVEAVDDLQGFREGVGAITCERNHIIFIRALHQAGLFQLAEELHHPLGRASRGLSEAAPGPSAVRFIQETFHDTDVLDIPVAHM